MKMRKMKMRKRKMKNQETPEECSKHRNHLQLLPNPQNLRLFQMNHLAMVVVVREWMSLASHP